MISCTRISLTVSVCWSNTHTHVHTHVVERSGLASTSAVSSCGRSLAVFVCVKPSSSSTSQRSTSSAHSNTPHVCVCVRVKGGRRVCVHRWKVNLQLHTFCGGVCVCLCGGVFYIFMYKRRSRGLYLHIPVLTSTHQCVLKKEYMVSNMHLH